MNNRKTNETAFEYDEIIKSHYDKIAKEEKDNATSTMASLYVRDAETAFITNMVRDFVHQQKTEHFTNSSYATGPGKDGIFNVLDVGCGNGYTLQILKDNFPKLHFTGLEFNDSLRGIAKKSLSKLSIDVLKADIRKKETLKQFDIDILICQRVIINIMNPVHQKKALENLLNVVSDGGLLVFIESFKSGMISLNNSRKEFQLEALTPAHHNLYLSDDFFNFPGLEEFDLSQKEFLSTHYFVSRVLHQSFLDASKHNFVRNSEFVSFFSHAFPHSIGFYSPSKFLSFTKQKNL